MVFFFLKKKKKKRQTERKKHCLPFLVNKYCVLILQNILKNGLHRAGSVHFKT